MSGESVDTFDDGCGSDDASDGGGVRPYIGVHFECCGVYARIYRRPDQQFYRGRCPKCLRSLTVRVGSDGVSQRIFRAR